MADRNVRPTGGRAKKRPPDDGLFKVAGDELGEMLPHGAPDGVGGALAVGGAGVGGVGGEDDGDGAAAFAAVVFEEALVEMAAGAGVAEGGGRDAEHLGDIGGILGGFGDVDGAAIA